jgi:hypothetical protein
MILENSGSVWALCAARYGPIRSTISVGRQLGRQPIEDRTGVPKQAGHDWVPHQHATHSKTVLVHAQLNHEVVLRTLRPGARIVLGNGVGASGLTIAVIARQAHRKSCQIPREIEH